MRATLSASIASTHSLPSRKVQRLVIFTSNSNSNNSSRHRTMDKHRIVNLRTRNNYLAQATQILTRLMTVCTDTTIKQLEVSRVVLKAHLLQTRLIAKMAISIKMERKWTLGLNTWWRCSKASSSKSHSSLQACWSFNDAWMTSISFGREATIREITTHLTTIPMVTCMAIPMDTIMAPVHSILQALSYEKQQIKTLLRRKKIRQVQTKILLKI